LVFLLPKLLIISLSKGTSIKGGGVNLVYEPMDWIYVIATI
jgi:hypothetical protein